MKAKSYPLKVLCSLAVLFVATGAARTQASNEAHGSPPQTLIQLHAESMSLADILAHLSEALQADIYVVNPAEIKFTGVHFQDMPALHVLQAVLHGQSYAVVYRSGAGEEPIHFLGTAGCASSNPPAGALTAPTDAGTADLESERPSDREEELRNQIQEIEDQIASGYADEWYEHWVNIRGREYIVNPRERLNYYREELANLY